MPGSFDNDAGEAWSTNGVGRLHKLFKYTFASHDPSAKVRTHYKWQRASRFKGLGLSP
jgi:hypothetical protein